MFKYGFQSVKDNFVNFKSNRGLEKSKREMNEENRTYFNVVKYEGEETGHMVFYDEAGRLIPIEKIQRSYVPWALFQDCVSLRKGVIIRVWTKQGKYGNPRVEERIRVPAPNKFDYYDKMGKGYYYSYATGIIS